MKETVWGESVVGGRLPCAPPPFLTCSKTFFLLSCLGEKRGVPFHAEQGVVQKGPQEPLVLVIPTSFFLSFFLPLFPIFFVSLIGLTDHSSFTYRLGRGGRS